MDEDNENHNDESPEAGEAIEINVDTCDSPTRGAEAGLAPVDFFLPLSLAKDRMSRRSSLRSSITSIDSIHIKSKFSHFQVENIPSCDAELMLYAKEVAENFRKTSYIKEVLGGSWIRDAPNAQCQDQFGNTLVHAAAKLGEAKLVSALAHYEADLDARNANDDTPMHFAAEKGHSNVLESLIKHGSKAIEAKNRYGFTPLQVAAITLHTECIESFVKAGANHLVMTGENETLLHLACKALLCKVLTIKDTMTSKLESIPEEVINNGGVDEDVPDDYGSDESTSYCRNLEEAVKARENEMLHSNYHCLSLLIELFKKNPDFLEIEDRVPTSPGYILHYFASLNFVDGVRLITNEPFLVTPNSVNKNGLSALWIASWYNMTKLGILLLDRGAEANFRDPERGFTPLHCAIFGYHINRVQETVDFVDALLEHGANPRTTDMSGETAPHLAIGTLDFQVISKFIDYLGPDEVGHIRDESGNTLFHFAAGCLDEQTIYTLMLKGACLMSKNYSEVIIDREPEVGDSLDDGLDLDDLQMSANKLERGQSVTVSRIPLQEAMKNGNSANYFDALRRLNFKADVLARMDAETAYQFLCTHLVAATREVRPDVVRLLFQQITDRPRLHHILLYKDAGSDDETYTKTALEWAVENNDRLCTTEILHQEYECHRHDRRAGLNCLRRQLTGDELLIWTIETFTMFYEKTWAQSVMIPLMGLIPLFFSISTFVYDYYSDFELSYEYYNSAFNFNPNGTNVENENNSTGRTNSLVGDGELCRMLNSSHLIVPKDFKPTSNSNCSLLLWNLVKSTAATTSTTMDDKNNNFMTSGDLGLGPSAADFCIDITRTSNEYRTAFFVNIVCIALPICIFYFMCARELQQNVKSFEARCFRGLASTDDSLAVTLLRVLLWAFFIPASIICAPFFVLFVAAKQVYYKFQHRRAKRKNKFRNQLQKTEYLWGISRTAEAALESCGQLILQIWLLSSDFNSLSKDDFGTLVDKTYNGVIFFLSFSIKEATDIEKSLGKIFMSLIALVCGVAASYRTLKRGSVKMSNTAFIYLSLSFQIFARMFSAGLFFFAVRNFMPTVPILLSIHFLMVFILKWSFERARHTHGMMALLVAVLNVFASSLVYVRIVPIDKPVVLARTAKQRRCQPSHNVTQHTTFFIQTLFFLLVMVENLILASWPLIRGGNNRALACLGEEKIYEYVGIVFSLCVASWISHILYYKYMGHPWTEINGPSCSRGRLRFNFHWCGDEKVLDCVPCVRCSSDSLHDVDDDDDQDSHELKKIVNGETVPLSVGDQEEEDLESNLVNKNGEDIVEGDSVHHCCCGTCQISCHTVREDEKIFQC